MSDPVFFRGSLPDLWIGLATSVPLGLIGGVDVVQDPFGVPGVVSLLHVPSGARVPVPVVPWGSEGRNLGGRVALAQLPAGAFRIQGRMADPLGVVVDFDMGFVLLDGPAPENNGVFLSSVGVNGILRPGLSVAFPGGSQSAVAFPPVTRSVRF